MEPEPDHELDEPEILRQMREAAQMEAEADVGYDPQQLIGAIGKRLADLAAGRGGVESPVSLLDKVYWIKNDLPNLRSLIKFRSLEFTAASSRYDGRKYLKLPLKVRKEKAVHSLGCVCVKCGFETSITHRSLRYHGKCPRCGSRLKPVYIDALKQMIYDEGIIPKKMPEAVVMNRFWDRMTETYVAVYKAWKLFLDDAARRYGWQYYRIPDENFRRYLEDELIGRITGETKIPREEKQVLQFLVEGPLASIPVKEAEQLIRACMKVVKYGYLHEQMEIQEAKFLYEQAMNEKELVYNRIYEKVKRILAERYGATSISPSSVTVVGLREGKYAPCLQIPQTNWMTGNFQEVRLKPLYSLPVFPKANYGAIQTVYGRLGSGKTFLLSSIICYSVLEKHQMVFVPLGDRTNTLSLACMPFMGYSERTKSLEAFLDGMGVNPQGLPVLNLTFLRRARRFLTPGETRLQYTTGSLRLRILSASRLTSEKP